MREKERERERERERLCLLKKSMREWRHTTTRPDKILTGRIVKITSNDIIAEDGRLKVP